ncbi:hypothetical protein L842_2220 [Mycobacterium intracellulare MIN_052511_1280]|nr:hypothetical protein L842_2220 [Mycobacterium intracellulare MIN_052511_1280]
MDDRNRCSRASQARVAAWIWHKQRGCREHPYSSLAGQRERNRASSDHGDFCSHAVIMALAASAILTMG